jgi:hypothetical protein
LDEIERWLTVMDGLNPVIAVIYKYIVAVSNNSEKAHFSASSKDQKVVGQKTNRTKRNH